jgi:hypothetical protein
MNSIELFAANQFDQQNQRLIEEKREHTQDDHSD